MVRIATNRHGARPGEEGYILVAVMFLLAILILSMAVAVPRVREDIQRDHEVETMHRGMQYRRALKLYYKKFNAYPPNIDALVKTNEIRFLRKRYTDPITGKDDWKPIMFGQNKTPMVMGFFGQALAGGSTLAGTGPGGIAGATPIGSTSGMSGLGSSFSNGGSFGGSSSFSGGSSFSSGGSTFGSSGSGSSTGSSPATGSSSTTSGSSGSSSSDSGPSLSSNQTFGGGGIIGFSPGSPKESILTYKKKNHYNEWEFLYSPQQDQMMLSGGNLGTIGQPASGLGNSGFGAGTQPGSGSFSNTPGGSMPTAPSSPTTPQQ